VACPPGTIASLAPKLLYCPTSCSGATAQLPVCPQVIPLALSGQRLGALCVEGCTPGALPDQAVHELSEYGAQLSQLLYALAVQEEKAAGRGSCGYWEWMLQEAAHWLDSTKPGGEGCRFATGCMHVNAHGHVWLALVGLGTWRSQDV
jgi:hypothetical protein